MRPDNTNSCEFVIKFCLIKFRSVELRAYDQLNVFDWYCMYSFWKDLPRIVWDLRWIARCSLLLGLSKFNFFNKWNTALIWILILHCMRCNLPYCSVSFVLPCLLRHLPALEFPIAVWQPASHFLFLTCCLSPYILFMKIDLTWCQHIFSGIRGALYCLRLQIPTMRLVLLVSFVVQPFGWNIDLGISFSLGFLSSFWLAATSKHFGKGQVRGSSSLSSPPPPSKKIPTSCLGEKARKS